MNPLVAFLNHLLRQTPGSQERLAAYMGKTVLLGLPPIEITLTIIENGEFAPGAQNAIPDAHIHLPPSAALRLLTEPEAAAQLTRIEGDVELASTVGKVLHQLRWEYEEDLSQLIGDIPAHGIAKFGHHILSTGRRQLTSLAEMFTEYWKEEQPIVAKPRPVEKFATKVDALREDIDRLEKRLRKLESAQ